jgi:hypothetical protein
VVAKRLRSSYRPGERGWLKIKNRDNLALPIRAGSGDARPRVLGGLALIESLHVATGAAAGTLLGSRRRAQTFRRYSFIACRFRLTKT